jgi:hypothetical protein
MKQTTTSAKGKIFEIPDYTPEQRKEMLKPYAQKIGELVVIWNTLHDRLSHIFSHVLKASDRDKMAIAVWHSTENDYLQRKMLRAAAANATELKENERKAIVWLLNKIDESLRHSRNDAIHAPWILMSGIVDDQLKSWYAADLFSLNPHVKPLKWKDMLEELKDYEEFAGCLASYAGQLRRALNNPARYAWPDKPKLPHAHRTKSPKGFPHKNNAK